MSGEIYFSETAALETAFAALEGLLGSLTTETFDGVIAQVNRTQSDIRSLKARLEDSLEGEALEKFREEYGKRAKQMKGIYDNLIELKKIEMQRVQEDLRRLQNGKKLASYQR